MENTVVITGTLKFKLKIKHPKEMYKNDFEISLHYETLPLHTVKTIATGKGKTIPDALRNLADELEIWVIE